MDHQPTDSLGTRPGPDAGLGLKDRKPFLAGLLSLLVDGLGQVYNGEAAKGVYFFFIGLGWLALALLVGPWLGLYGLTGALCLAFIPKLVFVAEAASTARRVRFIKPKGYNRPAIYILVILASLALQETLILPAADRMLGRPRIGSLQYYINRAIHMSPIIPPGSDILVDTGYYRTQEIQRGDIVLFSLPQRPENLIIGRVIGLSGERIRIRDKKVFLNGLELKEGYTHFQDPEIRPRGASARDNFGPAPIPVGSYFILGDNRDQSWDSRFFGAILEDRILGKVVRRP